MSVSPLRCIMLQRNQAICESRIAAGIRGRALSAFVSRRALLLLFSGIFCNLSVVSSPWKFTSGTRLAVAFGSGAVEVNQDRHGYFGQDNTSGQISISNNGEIVVNFGLIYR